MNKLLILAALLAAALAAPTIEKQDFKPTDISLQRPSPINPNIQSDPRPADRIIMITDPLEIEKFEKKNEQPAVKTAVTRLTPVTAAETDVAAVVHHRQKRDQKKGGGGGGKKSAPAPPPPKPKGGGSSKDKGKRHKREATTSDQNVNTQTAVAVPLIYKDRHLQPKAGDVSSTTAHTNHELPPPTQQHALQTPQTLPAYIPATAAVTTANIKPEASPAVLPPRPRTPETITTLSALRNLALTANAAAATNQHAGVKRDIPVPLVPKHLHPEESPRKDDKESKLSNEDKSSEETKDKVQVEALSERHQASSTTSTTTTAAIPSLLRPHPVPVAELFARPKADLKN